MLSKEMSVARHAATSQASVLATAFAAVTTVPDVVVSSITLPASVVQGSALSFSYVALNQGGATAGAHYAGISFDAQPTASSFLAYNYVSALGAYGSQTLSNSISTVGLSLGTHTLFIKEDFYGNAVSESDETNNVMAVTFTVTAPVAATAPDLVVSSILAPASVVQGSALAFSFAAFNQGSGSAAAHYAGISIDAQPSASSFLAYNAVSALGAYGTQTLSNSISTAGLSLGTHTLYIKEDFYGNAVSESDEGNNVRAVTFTVTAPVATTAPDLVISSYESPVSSVVQGSALTFTYLVQNQGSATAAAHYAGISIDTPPTASSFITYNYVGALGASASQTLTNSISTAGLSLGNHTLYFMEDFYGNAVSESNESNNAMSVTFTVTAPLATAPDVVVSSITRPASVVQGGALAFSFVATNQGAASAGAHFAGISIDTPPTASSYLAYNAVSALGAYGTQTLSNSISTAGLSVGTHTLFIKEDFYGNAVSESDEDNNLMAVTFTVTSQPSNRSPVVAAAMPDLSWTEGSALSYVVPAGTFTDPDGNALAYSASLSTGAALPSWLSFSPTTSTFSGTAPVGSPDYTVRVKAMDAGGLSTFDDMTFFTPTAPTAGGFNITLSFTGDQAYAPYFSQAKAIWERVITGDLPDYAGVDDLAIAASVVYIDGPYNTLAAAGPTNFRYDSTSLPYKGVMKFDSADMAMMQADGSLMSVITHEMGHVLGFGTTWDWAGFNNTFGQYTGAAALREYRTLIGNPYASFVPLETGGGTGTANAHWREAIFGDELMTGYAESSGPMPLSRMTIAAMADLGYTVNYAAAESYTLSAALVGITSDTATVAALLVV